MTYCVARAHRLERDGLPFEVLPLGYGVGAGIALKEIVEAAVFLNDDDDVFDRIGAYCPHDPRRYRRAGGRLRKWCAAAACKRNGERGCEPSYHEFNAPPTGDHFGTVTLPQRRLHFLET